ncbi:MBOAT family O-acyltransferase [Candidatus Uabimicrobium amorphum]|uniref:MBOAT family O-acyltransferase n=1 Tax=Uabimicrobium amorphum TaxID=2596890 RepID=UPI0015673BCC
MFTIITCAVFYAKKSLQYKLFLLAIVGLLLLFFIIFTHNKSTRRKIILLAASYIFYMYWNPAFICLILFSTIVDYYLSILIAKSPPSKKKTFLLMSIFCNLGILFFFKYANFFQDNLLLVMRIFGYDPSWTSLNIILPVGISFYTFQTMSYTIDVYKDELAPCSSPLDFALFVSFFPQLVAGPIVRAKEFLPQLKIPIKLNWDTESLFLIVRGLVKKVIIADNIAMFADFIFTSPQGFNSTIIWFATICFYIQIYCDFSGYSDMAIGIAKILGFHLPLNFDRPYFATNPSMFWKKWHISLSTWLRDYLYIPLGGNRQGTILTYRNLMLTMILGGLWHGASWNFILWGFLHGFALVLYHVWQKRFQKNFQHFVFKLMAFFAMQVWVLLTWITFRVTDFADMLYCLQKFVIFDFNFQFRNIGLGTSSLFLSALLVLFFYMLHLYSFFCGGIDKLLAKLPLWKMSLLCVMIGMILFALWPIQDKPFIYFQF